jgi:hypothetical protein
MPTVPYIAFLRPEQRALQRISIHLPIGAAAESCYTVIGHAHRRGAMEWADAHTGAAQDYKRKIAGDKS